MRKHDLHFAPLFAAASNMSTAEERQTILTMRRMYRTEQRLQRRLERVGPRRFLLEAIAIAKRRGDEARNRFVMQYVRLAVHLAKRYSGLNGRTLDELVSFGLLQLTRYAPRFRPGKARPITYLWHTLIYSFRRICGLSDRPTAASVARHTSDERVLDALSDRRAIADLERKDREETTAYRLAFVGDCLPNLDERQQDVIRQRYFVGSTLQEVGERMGVSRERCRQLEEKGLLRLRKHFAAPIPTWVANGAPVLVDRRTLEFRRSARESAIQDLSSVADRAGRREVIIEPSSPPGVSPEARRTWLRLKEKERATEPGLKEKNLSIFERRRLRSASRVPVQPYVNLAAKNWTPARR